MEKNQLVYLASIAIGKGIDRERFKYSDYMYDIEDEIDNVWEYVDECQSIGTIAFKQKYSAYHLYI